MVKLETHQDMLHFPCAIAMASFICFSANAFASGYKILLHSLSVITSYSLPEPPGRLPPCLRLQTGHPPPLPPPRCPRPHQWGQEWAPACTEKDPIRLILIINQNVQNLFSVLCPFFFPLKLLFIIHVLSLLLQGFFLRCGSFFLNIYEF